MAASQRKIGDNSELAPAITPQAAAPSIVPIGDILPDPVPSPARALQQRLTERAADLRLPAVNNDRNELSVFIMCTVLLWGGALGGIAGLMLLTR
jgi:hypothetical protein